VNANSSLTLGEIFEGLAPKTRRDFEALGHKSCYPPGTILFGAGEACDSICWIVSGEVSVSVRDGFGRCVMSHVAEPGEILGLKAALCGEAHGTTARTEGPCEMTCVSRDDFSAFLSSHPDAAFSIVQQISTRLGIALDQLRSIPPKPPN